MYHIEHWLFGVHRLLGEFVVLVVGEDLDDDENGDDEVEMLLSNECGDWFFCSLSAISDCQEYLVLAQGVLRPGLEQHELDALFGLLSPSKLMTWLNRNRRDVLSLNLVMKLPSTLEIVRSGDSEFLDMIFNGWLTRLNRAEFLIWRY